VNSNLKEDGTGDSDLDGVVDMEDTDLDGDGWEDVLEVTAYGNLKEDGTGDSDLDGVVNMEDAFPNDGTESVDTDGDGIGDNGEEFGGFILSTVSVGKFPKYVVSGEGDNGNTILVSVNRNSDSVSGIVGTDSSFELLGNVSVGNYPVSIGSGDLDGDGDLDVVTADKKDNVISVLLGDGEGSFGDRRSAGTGKYPMHLEVLELTGDGNLDVAVANWKGKSVSILTGDGAGNFSETQELSIGGKLIALTGADLDNDGDTDLVVNCYTDKTLSVLENNGSGTFSVANTYSLSGKPYNVTSADFDGDGNADVAFCLSTDEVEVAFGNGDLSLGDMATYTTGADPRDIKAMDIEGDGDWDLVVSSDDDQTVSVYLGDGSGAFESSPLIFNVGGRALGLSMYDYDADGDTDVFVALRYNDEIAILENVSGAGYESVQGVVADGYISGARVFLDIDGDEEWSEGEPYSITDEEGNFTLVTPNDSGAEVISEGGTDVSTGTAFDGKLKGPRGSKVLSPLGTVMHAMVRKGHATDYNTANELLTLSLGLDDGSEETIDFRHFDPLARAENPKLSKTQRERAVKVGQAAVQIGSLMVAVVELGGDPSTLAESIAADIPNNEAGAKGFRMRDKLSDSTHLQKFMEKSTSKPAGGNKPTPEQLRKRAGMLAGTNDKIQGADKMADIAGHQGAFYKEIGVGPRAGGPPRPGLFKVVKKGKENVFDVTLRQKPTGEVLVDVDFIGNPSGVVLTESVLSFDETNWNRVQTVEITSDPGNPPVEEVRTDVRFTVNDAITEDDAFVDKDPESFPFKVTAGPKVVMSVQNGIVVLRWESGVLQQAPSVTGPWKKVVLPNPKGALPKSPFTLKKPDKQQMFYRLVE